MNTKINAFTIMEVTIAMLLASITIAIAFAAYTMISKSYFQFDEKNKKIAEYLLLDQLLKKDFEAAYQILNLGDEIQIATSKGKISYAFEKDYILRDHYSIKTDTFFIKIREKSFSYEDREVILEGLVDEIKLDIDFKIIKSYLHYNKLYSAEELIKSE